MNNTGPHNPPVQPDRELVECAIVELLGIAERHGITAAHFIQMLDSGMRIADFLTAMDELTNAETIPKVWVEEDRDAID
jgi:hypothetical protein